MDSYDPKIETSLCDWTSTLISRPVKSFKDLISGLQIFDCLLELDRNYFSVWGNDLFKNLDSLTSQQALSVAQNNWSIIVKSFQTYLEKENFQEGYLEVNPDLITAGDQGEFFSFFIIFISVVLVKKKYLWNQSIGLVSNSTSYNYLKDLEANLAVGGDEGALSPVSKQKDRDRDENNTLANMITDLQKNLKEEMEKGKEIRLAYEQKKDENEEIKRQLDQKVFDYEKVKMRMEALELNQNEFYDAISIKKDYSRLTEQLSKAEKREEELEMENMSYREKIAAQEKKIRDLKETEAKYAVEQGLQTKFNMILEKNDGLLAEQRKKDLEIDGLNYQVELLKKSKEALELGLSNSKVDNMKLERQILALTEELKGKEQEIGNLDRIIIKLKENLEMNMMSPSPNKFDKSPGFSKSKIGFSSDPKYEARRRPCART